MKKKFILSCSVYSLSHKLMLILFILRVVEKLRLRVLGGRVVELNVRFIEEIEMKQRNKVYSM